MARSDWEGKSDSYRSRLIGAGRSGTLSGRAMTPAEVQRYWEGGGDLRAGRSHRPAPTGQAPQDAIDRESVGLGDGETMRDLERWRDRPPSRGGPPEWLRSRKAWERPPDDALEVEVTGYRKTGPTSELPPETGGDRMDETVISTDTAAILSQIDIPPRRWQSVEMVFLDTGGVVVNVQPKGNAYPRTVIFPDYESAQQVGRLLNLARPQPKRKRTK